jgi:omega-hydroxy-beta-dihydromenaquinone-9 sulfotransferase
MAALSAPHVPSPASAGKAALGAGTPGGKFHRYPWWAPRFWHGMTLGVWLRFAGRNGFRISPTRWPMAVGITIVSVFNTAMWLLQQLLLGRRVDRSSIAHPPIFIIGHWRSGTTYLHELLVLDDRFAFPTTYECFAPAHFLISDWLVAKYMKFLLPTKRPMDNMAAGWDLPQEDEFALCNLGLGSPYKTMGFPNRQPQDAEYLDLKQLSPVDKERWKSGVRLFLKRVAYRKQRPIVLKSPPHTARVRTLLELFPHAKFVHIVRDPINVFLSTVRLWRSLYQVQGLQVDKGHDVTEYVLSTFERMYASFEEDRPLLKPNQYYEVRYEDLVANSLGQIRAMYEQLNLGDFEQVQPRLAAFLEAKKDYQTNRFEAPEEVRAMVMERWADFARRYGYLSNDER